MYQDRIEYLRRAIKRTYKRYIGERTDGKATLLDVAKFFNIPVDESRMGDYVINNINYSTPSIEITDGKNAISYHAAYTGNADLLNFSGATQFNKVVSVSPLRKEETLYYIGSETPIITKMTFTNGEYQLVFEREMPNSVSMFVNDGVRMIIRYLQDVVYDGKNVKQPLFNRIYKNSYGNEEFDGVFEQTYTYGPHRFIRWTDSQDKYAYIKNNKVIYGINELEQEDLCNYMRGICFESTNVNVSRYLPYNIDIKDFPELTNNEMYQSGIVFRGGTGNGIHHTFTIFKTKNQDDDKNESEKNTIDYDIYLKYEAIKWEHFEKENGEPDHRKVVVAHKETRYPRIDNGNITSLEIRNITEVLDTEFEDDAFIQIVINELKTFANKMDIQKGMVQEELDPLSPKLFIDKSFEEICTLVSANKDDYFKLISEQFETAANINKSPKGQSKVLKPKNLQSSEN